ncbi:MAG: hypothetical protein F6K65_44210, partial [Moorea sp. SIO3C2]|nr:hypothetical protein [Moorena sp. SIO3C2]
MRSQKLIEFLVYKSAIAKPSLLPAPCSLLPIPYIQPNSTAHQYLCPH